MYGTRTGLIYRCAIVIAGFFTGGALAIRGGMKAARNSAIGCGILLAVIEGVGIGIQRMMAENTRLDVRLFLSSKPFPLPATQAILTTFLFRYSYRRLPLPHHPRPHQQTPAHQCSHDEPIHISAYYTPLSQHMAHLYSQGVGILRFRLLVLVLTG